MTGDLEELHGEGWSRLLAKARKSLESSGGALGRSIGLNAPADSERRLVIGITGQYRPEDDDPLRRSYIGCFPRMTEAEAWEAGRGVWKMNRSRAISERFALIVGQDKVIAAAQVKGVNQYDDRIALEGDLLQPGHPVYNTYIGRPDPLPNQSRNSVTYGDLPEEAEFRTRPCACGCGETCDRDFAPGHEVRAIQARIRDHFGGSPLALIQWIDANRPQPAR